MGITWESISPEPLRASRPRKSQMLKLGTKRGQAGGRSQARWAAQREHRRQVHPSPTVSTGAEALGTSSCCDTLPTP